jgi:hypothetical protein
MGAQKIHLNRHLRSKAHQSHSTAVGVRRIAAEALLLATLWALQVELSAVLLVEMIAALPVAVEGAVRVKVVAPIAEEDAVIVVDGTVEIPVEVGLVGVETGAEVRRVEETMETTARVDLVAVCHMTM